MASPLISNNDLSKFKEFLLKKEDKKEIKFFFIFKLKNIYFGL
jgi:hypothetical protein